MSTLFVTATGTEIGKTLVAAALCHELRAAGRPVRALKPVLSGYDPATLAESDPGVLLASLGEAVTEEAVAEITPWRFAAPLSPDMAAAREGRRLDLADIVAFCRAAQGDPLLIEGIGGSHGAAQRRPHRARLDRGARRAGAGGDGQLPRHHQPHAHHARGHTRARHRGRRSRHQRIAGESGATSGDGGNHRPKHAGPLPIAHVPRLSASPAPWREAPPLARALGLLEG